MGEYIPDIEDVTKKIVSIARALGHYDSGLITQEELLLRAERIAEEILERCRSRGKEREI